MGRRNTKREPSWHRKQKPKSLAKVRPAGTLPWLGLARVQPNRWLSRGSLAESTHWRVLHRPVELARVIVQVVLPRFHFCDKRVNRPSAATVHFDYFSDALQNNFRVANNPPARATLARMRIILSLVAGLIAR
jgi:hypothetical protein